MTEWAYFADALHYKMTNVGLLMNEEGQLRLAEQDRYELGRAEHFEASSMTSAVARSESSIVVFRPKPSQPRASSESASIRSSKPRRGLASPSSANCFTLPLPTAESATLM